MSTSALDRFRAVCAADDHELPLDRLLAIVAEDEGSTVDSDLLVAELDGIAAGIRITATTPPIETVARLNHRLFHEIGFSGDTEAYDHPLNSRLDHVLAHRRGLPILLSAIYIEVARRSGVHVDGIGFPGHFLVALPQGEGEFFVDPFHRGQIWRHERLTLELQRVIDGVVTPEVVRVAVRPTSTRELLVRVNHNLKVAWARRSDPWGTLRAIERLLALQPDRVQEIRDRGRIHAIVGDAAAARQDFTSYLERCPEAHDRAKIEQELTEL